MNYSLSLSASILGTISSIALVQPAALALTASEIDRIAEAVTVRIDTPGSSGSGVIIQREGNTYTVLTAHHVIDSIRGNEEAYVIPASDERQSYRVINSSIRALPNNVDLAIFQFQSSATYQTATLGNSDAMNRGEKSYVSGYPLLTAALNQPLRQFTQGDITANATQPLDGGYGIVYSNDTLPGMSGGPVFNSNGEVVGIHGRADVDQTRSTGNSGVVVKTGFNLAVPINTFRRWNEQNRVLAVNTSEPIPAQRVETNETQASNFLLQGGEQYRAGNYQQAIADFNQAIRLNPNLAQAYYSRGVVKRQLGDKQGAIADFNQAIRINPEYAEAYNNRGNAKSDLGDYQGAIVDFNQAIRINPNLALPYYNRGVAKQGLGDNQGAIADYNQAIRLNPRLADAYNNRGNAKGRLGDHQGAIADFNQAIRINPDDALAYYNRGNAKGRLGDHQGAIADFNQAIRINPNDAEAYYNRAIAKGRLGDHQGAIADYNQAIRINPNDAEAYVNRGVAYGQLGDNQSALRNFQEAARLARQQGNTGLYNFVQEQIRRLN